MRSRFNKPIFRILAALTTLIFLTFSLHFLRTSNSNAPDFPCTTDTQSSEVNVEIASGESGSEIAQSLFKNGVVKSSESFFRVAVGDARAQKIAPGVHRLSTKICAWDALSQLLDPSRISGLINITEGAWVSEVIPQLYEAGMSKADVASALKSATKPAGFTSLEGLLFPAQYSFEKGTPAKVAIQAMIDRSVKEMKSVGFFTPGQKFSPQQLLTIASLLQAEGNTVDFPKISQVIRNRLAKGMPLQFDSTVHYVKRSRGSVFLSTESTLINSPYNSYKHYGLPPGPINNPGSDALKAAVNPTAGDWLYFITVAPHDTRYTSDINEFNLWKIEYRKNLKAGKFRSRP